MDWRTWLGLSLTIAWLLLGALYVSDQIGWSQFAALNADALGSFLEA